MGTRIDNSPVTDAARHVYIEQDVTKPPLADVTELVTELAVSAVAVQRTLDAYRTGTLERLSDEDVDRLRAVGLGTLTAPQYQVSEFRVATSLAVRISREREVKIAVRPVNLAFRLARGSEETTESRIEICVNRVPLPDAGPARKATAAGAGAIAEVMGGNGQ